MIHYFRRERRGYGIAADRAWRRWGLGARVMTHTGISFEFLFGPFRLSAWYDHYWRLTPLDEDEFE